LDEVLALFAAGLDWTPFPGKRSMPVHTLYLKSAFGGQVHRGGCDAEIAMAEVLEHAAEN
jgi:hypothetical protein